MDVSVIIVTFNSESCIEQCLASVAAQTGVDAETIVVDNASADHTVERVKKFPVRLFANGENIGYGRANNQGFAASQGRFIYLLNPDTELVGHDSLISLCRALEAHPDWGMAGTRIQNMEGNRDTLPAFSYPGQRHVKTDFSSLPGEIAWVLGASMFMRREAFAALQGFDPGFFHASEDTDLCLRLRKLGHTIGHIPEVKVRHIGGASEVGLDPYELCKHKINSMLRFRQKHYSARDGINLARRDRFRARFRMMWYGLIAQFQAHHSHAWFKHRQYQAIWEVSRDFLSSRKSESPVA